MEELRNKILKVFFDRQCYDDDGSLIDECPGVRYSTIEHFAEIKRACATPVVKDLRNEGYITLEMTVDQEYYMPSGSGYFLTEKGADLCTKMFIKKE